MCPLNDNCGCHEADDALFPYPPPGEDGIVPTDQNRLALIRKERKNPLANLRAFRAVGAAARQERQTREARAAREQDVRSRGRSGR